MTFRGVITAMDLDQKTVKLSMENQTGRVALSYKSDPIKTMLLESLVNKSPIEVEITESWEIVVSRITKFGVK